MYAGAPVEQLPETYLVRSIVASKAGTMSVYADLEGCKINGGTVPGDLVATGQVPDIVLLDRSQKKIVLLELTCPFDSSASSFKSAFDRKTERYVRLALDLVFGNTLMSSLPVFSCPEQL